jgi:CDP-diacylglycerol--serine O-phosphatidyltransferase
MTRILQDEHGGRRLDVAPQAKNRFAARAIVGLRRLLARSRYAITAGSVGSGEVGITPLLGFGHRDNQLNA